MAERLEDECRLGYTYILHNTDYAYFVLELQKVFNSAHLAFGNPLEADHLKMIVGSRHPRIVDCASAVSFTRQQTDDKTMFQKQSTAARRYYDNAPTVIVATLAALLFMMPSDALALPHQDGVVTVGDRKFFVGALTSSFGDDARSFDFRHVPWLKALLDNDPLLSDQDVRFLRSGVPAPDLIGELPTQLRAQQRFEDDPMYMAEGHDVVTSGDRHEYIYPKDSPIRYSVFCTRGGFNPGELNICGIDVAYPYGSNVVLTATKYFPGKLPEISGNFEHIAARMIEIAICLDVTNLTDGSPFPSEVALLARHPDLSGCDILLNS